MVQLRCSLGSKYASVDLWYLHSLVTFPQYESALAEIWTTKSINFMKMFIDLVIATKSQHLKSYLNTLSQWASIKEICKCLFAEIFKVHSSGVSCIKNYMFRKSCNYLVMGKTLYFTAKNCLSYYRRYYDSKTITNFGQCTYQ